MQWRIIKPFFSEISSKKNWCHNIKRLNHGSLGLVSSQRDVFVKQVRDDADSRKRLRGEIGALTKVKPPKFFKRNLIEMRKIESIKSLLNFLREEENQHVVMYSAAVKHVFETSQNVDMIKQVIRQAEALKIELNVFFCGIVLNCLATCDRHMDVKHYFKKWFEEGCETMKEQPNLIVFTTMIKSCKERGMTEEAMQYFDMMQNKYNIEPDDVCYSLLLTVCANSCQVDAAEKLIQKRLDSLKPGEIIKMEMLGSLLNVYGKSGQLDKVMTIWSMMESHCFDSDTVFVNNFGSLEVWSTIVMASLLQAGKVEEMFTFYHNHICALGKIQKLDINDQKIVTFLCIGHIRMMETISGDNIDSLKKHHHLFLTTFLRELCYRFPIHSLGFRTIPLKEMDLLLQSFILLHKNDWTKAKAPFEVLWQSPQCQNSVFLLSRHRAIPRLLLDFHLISHITTSFILRYLVTFQRSNLQKNFHNGTISIICGGGNHSRMLKDTTTSYSRQSQNIQKELNTWIVPIRFNQHPDDSSVWFLDPIDVESLFQKVPPGHSCVSIPTNIEK